jgi:hypothetical protein
VEGWRGLTKFFSSLGRFYPIEILLQGVLAAREGVCCKGEGIGMKGRLPEACNLAQGPKGSKRQRANDSKISSN